jgi:hypothetical protein
MDHDETKARNDCAGEDQQQFNRPTGLLKGLKEMLVGYLKLGHHLFNPPPSPPPPPKLKLSSHNLNVHDAK